MSRGMWGWGRQLRALFDAPPRNSVDGIVAPLERADVGDGIRERLLGERMEFGLWDQFQLKVRGYEIVSSDSGELRFWRQ